MRNRFVIFTKENCDWCNKAVDLLDSENYSYFVWDVDDNPFAKEFLKWSGLKTVPQIYHNGHYIGGYAALENFLGIN